MRQRSTPSLAARRHPGREATWTDGGALWRRDMTGWLCVWIDCLTLIGVVLLSIGTPRTAPAQSATDGGAANLQAPTFEDLLQLRQFDELAISPDGRWAAYVMSAPFRAGRAPVSERIVLLDLHHHARLRAVQVSGHPHGLQWTARGNVLGFLASADGRSGLWRYTPRDSMSAPQPLVIHDSLSGEILAFGWSPTGDSAAYIASEPTVPGVQPASARIPPRLVLFRDVPGDVTGPTSPTFSRDSTGAYVALADAKTGAVRVLARHVISQKYSPTLDWSNRGMLLVTGSPIGVPWLRQITLRPLFTLDPRTGDVRQVAPDSLQRANPVWSPSGAQIASTEYHSFPEGGRSIQSFLLRVDNPASPAAALVFPHGAGGAATAFPPVWGRDDRQLYIAEYERGTVRLFAVDVASRRWRALTSDTMYVSHYAVSRDGKTVLAVLENANQPQELFQIDPVTGALTQLTHGAAAVPPMRLGHVDQVAWPSGDGRFTVHGFLIEPPAYDSTRRYPLIVLVHGGPGALFTNSFVDLNFARPSTYIPPQLFASAGYLVLLPNPRGDESYGEAFETALHADWGPGPFSDINAGVSALIVRGFVDSTAVGIAGSSYGGYLTAFAITQTRRFAAASINDGPTDLRTDYGTNYALDADIRRFTFGGTPWSKPEVYATQSPITYVSQVHTSVLMRYGGLSSTHDNIRLPGYVAQGFEFYAGLRDAGVPVEFVLHPDQGHGITDWGLYTDWVMRNLRWFNYWLRHEGPNPLSSVP